jgi:hypothetical protein
MILNINFFQAILVFQKKIQTILSSKIFPVIVIFKKQKLPEYHTPLY